MVYIIYIVSGADPGFFLGDRKPPLRLSAIFCLFVGLPRALQQFGSAPEIPVRTPPSECTKPPLLNPGSAPEYGVNYFMGYRSGCMSAPTGGFYTQGGGGGGEWGLWAWVDG